MEPTAHCNSWKFEFRPKIRKQCPKIRKQCPKIRKQHPKIRKQRPKIRIKLSVSDLKLWLFSDLF